MTPVEIAKLIGYIGFVDARVQIDEGKVQVWYETLDQRITLEQGRAIVADWYAHETAAIMPANINNGWRKEMNRLAEVEKNKELDREREERKALKADPNRVREIRELSARLAIENGVGNENTRTDR